MNASFPDSLPSQVQAGNQAGNQAAGTSHFPTATDSAMANEFGSFMDGLSASPRANQGPSAISMMVRFPVAESDRVMASLDTPPPPGASVVEKMEFYTQKQIDVANMKVLQNVATAAAKLTKKTIETIMNSK